MSSLEIVAVSAFIGAIIAGFAIIWKIIGAIAEIAYFSMDDPIEVLDDEIDEFKEKEEKLKAELRELLEETDDPKLKEKIRVALAS